jgi:hypothetical protein
MVFLEGAWIIHLECHHFSPQAPARLSLATAAPAGELHRGLHFAKLRPFSGPTRTFSVRSRISVCVWRHNSFLLYLADHSFLGNIRSVRQACETAVVVRHFNGTSSWSGCLSRKILPKSRNFKTGGLINLLFSPKQGKQDNATSTHRRMHTPRFNHEWFTESFVGKCTRPHIAITPLACHSSERRWRWKMYKLLPRSTTSLVRRAMCSRVARVPSCWDTSVLWCGSGKPTSNASSLAFGPNAEHSSREGEDTVYTCRLEFARRMFGNVWR